MQTLVNTFAAKLELVVPPCSPVVPTHIDQSCEQVLRIDEQLPLFWVGRRRESPFELEVSLLWVCHAVKRLHLRQDDHPHH
jgi:hypothetical protein